MSAEFEAVWAVADGIGGWLTKEQAHALASAAERLPASSSIVEIGSHHGRSTVVLGRSKPEGARLVAVDPFGDPRWGGGEDSYDVFRDNLARAGSGAGVEPFRGTSEEAAAVWDGGPIGLLYIDGAHDRSSVLTDIDAWEPFVADGGFVYVHDAFSSPGVTAALLERHLFERSFRYLGSVRSLAMFRREPLSLPETVWSGLRMLARLPYFARNLIVKVAMRRGWELPQRVMRHREPGYPY
jgi:predicted O-methyltransferase YrrM